MRLGESVDDGLRQAPVPSLHQRERKGKGRGAGRGYRTRTSTREPHPFYMEGLSTVRVATNSLSVEILIVFERIGCHPDFPFRNRSRAN